ncbi:MAG: polyprenyl synthetase family protein [Rhizobiales bacterium]|nr:polyprenyl synthetase family protein [Hyphomicrobiales bacterium]
MERVLASIPPDRFENSLAAAASATEALLDRLLPETGPAPRLVKAMRYAALGPGKRLRPFLVIESSRLFGVPEARALAVGAALECLHCYSLVHDDLPAMDDDDLRRGRPTLHRAFDEATAILAGDALLTFAFEILSRPEVHPDAEVRVKLIGELARAAGKDGMAGGQMLDLEAEDGRKLELEQVLTLQAMKTGALFRFAATAGAMLGGADPVPLGAYGRAIGLAFQIADDLLDVSSSAAALGKATQKDHARGKATFVDLLGEAGARRRADELVAEADVALAPYGARSNMLRAAARFIIGRRK